MRRGRYSAPIAGLIVGARLAVKSLEPSLMPRSAVDQGLIMAGSFATGFVSGAAAARVIGLLPVIGSPAALEIAGMAAAGSEAAGALGTTASPAGAAPSTTSAWREVGSETITSIAMARTGPNRSRMMEVATTLAVAGSTVTDAQAAIEARDDSPDAAYLITAAGTAVGTVVAVAGVLVAVRGSGRTAQRAVKSATGSRAAGALAFAAGVVGAAGLLAIVAKTAAGKGIAAMEAGNRATEVSYAGSSHLVEVTGGRESSVAYESLGLQGRRLVSEVSTAEAIERVMGEPARKMPVRIFIGEQSAPTIEDRVALAIHELHRSGGFDRSAIVAASPAGTGYVNYIMAEAVELMSRGDIATVAIQYGSLPSLLSMGKVEDASKQYAALIRALDAEIAKLATPIPVYSYGESLGAQTAQNAMEIISTSSGLPVDRALWVGTPTGTPLFTRLVDGEGLPVFDHPDQLSEYVVSHGDPPVPTYLDHDNDPVTKFSHSLFLEMPDWLATEGRGRGMNPNQRWLPGVAFFQAMIDTKNAATVIPGEFKSTGHDYRADLATFVRLAFGFDDVTPEQMSAIEDQLRASEIARSDSIGLGTVEPS